MENLVALRKIENDHLSEIEKEWGRTRRLMRGAIVEALGSAKKVGFSVRTRFLSQVQSDLPSIIGKFKTDISAAHGKHLAELSHTAALRTAWVLRSINPPNVEIKTPRVDRSKLKEADDYSGIGGSWSNSLDNYLDAWQDGLLHNLNLGAIRGETAQDAADEVDATRADTPAFGLWDKIDAVFRNSSVQAAADSFDEMSQANAAVGGRHVWHAFSDSILCPDCAELDEQYAEDIPGSEPPLHPNCRCLWWIEPYDWSKMADKRTRALMAEQGIDPDAMVSFDENGKPSAVTLVSFPDYVSDLESAQQQRADWGVTRMAGI